MSDLRDIAMQSKAWPYEEARKLLKRFLFRVLSAYIYMDKRLLPKTALITP